MRREERRGLPLEVSNWSSPVKVTVASRSLRANDRTNSMMVDSGGEKRRERRAKKRKVILQ